MLTLSYVMMAYTNGPIRKARIFVLLKLSQLEP